MKGVMHVEIHCLFFFKNIQVVKVCLTGKLSGNGLSSHIFSGVETC